MMDTGTVGGFEILCPKGYIIGLVRLVDARGYSDDTVDVAGAQVLSRRNCD